MNDGAQFSNKAHTKTQHFDKPSMVVLPSTNINPETFGENIQSLPKLEDFNSFRIWDNDPIPEPNHKIRFGDIPFATDRDTAGIAAPEKMGKTGLMGAIISGCINDSGHVFGMTEISVQPNKERKAVIHIDTEQSKSAQYRNHLSILKRGGLSSSPDHYYAYNVRSIDYINYASITESIFELASEKHNGIFAAVIDGLADYVKSVNDDEQAREILAYFARLAEKYDCPIILVVHVNPNSSKERGHVGSELRRKAGSLIGIEEVEGIPTVVPRLLRYGNKDNFPNIQLEWCNDRHYHVSKGIYQAPPRLSKGEKKAIERKQLAIKIFPNEETKLTYGDLLNEIEKLESVENRTAKNRKKDLDDYDYIRQDGEGFWRRNMISTVE